MRYVVLLAGDPSVWEASTEREREEYLDAHQAFEREVATRGAKVAGAALAAADTATTLRHEAGGLTVTHGPFVELAEQIGGLYLVDLPDLDAAVAAGGLLPASYTVEIRPVVDVPGPGPR